MAWTRPTKCAQCQRKLSKHDRDLGTVCTKCVTHRKSIWDDRPDDELNDDNND